MCDYSRGMVECMSILDLLFGSIEVADPAVDEHLSEIPDTFITSSGASSSPIGQDIISGVAIVSVSLSL